MQRVLILDQYPPMPDRNSGGHRLFEIMKIMRSEGHEVTFVPQHRFGDDEKYFADLWAMGVNTFAPRTGEVFAPQHLRAQFAGKDFDNVVLCFYTLAQTFLETCREMFPSAKLIIDTVDLHFVREHRHAEVTGDRQLMAKAVATRHNELSIYAKADALWAITPVERDILRREVTVSEIDVIPNIHEMGSTGAPYSQRQGLLFVGNFFHPPNAEGLGWFCQQVLPIVRAQLPDVKTVVVGANVPEFFQQFQDLGVSLAGYVPDLAPVLANARISIAPLLHGAGMKGKVGEALAHGLPCVTTSIGAEGIGLTHGSEVLVADSAEAFASAIVLAYKTEDLWNMLAVNGYSFMSSHFTPDAIRCAVIDAVRPSSVESYIGVPDWSDEVTVKRVVDAYIRSGSSSTSLCLALLDIDATVAADLLSQWIVELGHDLDAIPDIALTPMTVSQLASVAPDTIWIPMSRSVAKPAHVQNVETFCPIAVLP